MKKIIEKMNDAHEPNKALEFIYDHLLLFIIFVVIITWIASKI